VQHARAFEADNPAMTGDEIYKHTSLHGIATSFCVFLLTFELT